MSNNEQTTKMVANNENNQSMTVKDDAILQSALQVSSEMSKVESDTPENSLIVQAQRFNNVAHALIEKRENEYLEGEEPEFRDLNDDTIEKAIRLSSEARNLIRLSMDIKKEKSKAFTDLVKAMKGQ